MILPIILCGGMGRRLWPLSTEEKPKQFHHFISPTANNLQYVIETFGIGKNFDRPIISCNNKHLSLVEESLQKFKMRPLIMVEPIVKGTGPAICCITEYISKFNNDEHYLLILPSDIYIEDEREFKERINDIYSNSIEGIICFGIEPYNADPNFGYILPGNSLGKELCEIGKFVEKPSLERATSMLAQKGWLWNSGVFIGKVKEFKEEFQKYQPVFVENACNIINSLCIEENKLIIPKDLYDIFSEISIDKAVIEYTSKIKVARLYSRWFDLGNWDSLLNFKKSIIFNQLVV